MNKMFSTTAYAAKHMAGCIAKHALQLTETGGDAMLRNGRCTIRLSNIDNEFVSFEFWDDGKPGEVYGLSYYLDCAYDYRGLELNPNISHKLAAEVQFTGCLDNFERLLTQGYFDAPLAGDFSWVPAYHAMIAEQKRLGRERLRLADEGHPEAEAILTKKTSGDATWMLDVKRIIGELPPQ